LSLNINAIGKSSGGPPTSARGSGGGPPTSARASGGQSSARRKSFRQS